MSEHRIVAGGGASMLPTTSRTGPFRHLQRLSTWLASETTQRRIARTAYWSGLAAVGGVLYPVFTLPDYVPNPDLAGWRLLLAVPAIVALVSFPRWPSLTKTSGRILGGAALVLTTAAFTNGFMDRLRASRLDESDRWYVASQIEGFHATDFLLYTLAGAAFVLAAELKSDPVRDDQLLPPSRPRWLAGSYRSLRSVWWG